MKQAKLPEVVLIGLPNVGKSSIVNRLLRRRQAIVHNQAHTTRDTSAHEVDLDGVRFMLRDSAGFAAKGDDLHAAAMHQLDAALEAAAVIVMVVDAGQAVSDDERKLAARAHKLNKPFVLLANQVDKQDAQIETYQSLGIKTVFGVSAIHNIGFDDFQTALKKLIPRAEGALVSEEPSVSIAIVGRPNAGKSRLLNQLAGAQAAIVSSQAGTTRDSLAITRQVGDHLWRFVDTAGIRRPGKIERGVEKYSLSRAEQAIEEADICLLLLDVEELVTGQDQRLAGLIQKAGRGLILVVNKIDLVEMTDAERKRIDRVLRHEFEFIPWAPYVLISAETGLHIKELESQIASIAARLDTKIPTKELNKFLQGVVAKQPPSTGTTQHAHLNYIVQTASLPLTLTIFGTKPDLIHFSYKRYIENSMRAHYELDGIPLKIIFESKYKQDRAAAK